MWLMFLEGCASPAEPPPVAAPQVDAPPVDAPRLVAIGDLHGDSEAALAVLKMAALADDAGHWSGGTAILVQTGDILDRGPDSKGVLELLRRLEGEATSAGGRVVPLLGNHEVMNVQADWRYVSDEDIAGFGGLQSRVAAFLPDGEWGRWLATHDAVALVEGVVFCHGGLRPTWAAQGLSSINAEIRDGMFKPKTKEGVLGEDGPLWYRGFVNEPESEVCDDLQRTLDAVGARRMVVGHTVRDDGRIESRCAGRLDVIDTGISAYYGRHLAAFELVNGDARALYPSGTEDLPDPR
jgi:hypothetical protein